MNKIAEGSEDLKLAIGEKVPPSTHAIVRGSEIPRVVRNLGVRHILGAAYIGRALVFFYRSDIIPLTFALHSDSHKLRSHPPGLTFGADV